MNILLDIKQNLNYPIDSQNVVAKICDFGLSRLYKIPVKKYSQEVVTLWYRAPELLLNVDQYTASVDIWSVGCIMAELMIGTALFQGDSEIGQIYKIFQIRGTPSSQIYKSMGYWSDSFPQFKSVALCQVIPNQTAETIDLLEKMLELDPQKRITAEQALKHSYFQEFMKI